MSWANQSFHSDTNRVSLFRLMSKRILANKNVLFRHTITSRSYHWKDDSKIDCWRFYRHVQANPEQNQPFFLLIVFIVLIVLSIRIMQKISNCCLNTIQFNFFKKQCRIIRRSSTIAYLFPNPSIGSQFLFLFEMK